MITSYEQSPLVKVVLYGALATKYGREHHYLIRTPTEAIWALDANHPGFVRDFVQCKAYHVIADDSTRPGEQGLLTVHREVHLIPAIEGRAFLGASLVGWLFPALAGTFAAQLIGSLLIAGVLFGLSMLLKPKQPDKPKTDDKKDESFAFSGPENVSAQGVAVPLIYGRVFAGSVVVSAGLNVSDVPIT